MRPTVSDEELLLRWLLNKDDIAAMRAAGPAKDYVTARHPLVKLMAELTQRADCNLIQVSKTGFALTLERKAAKGLGGRPWQVVRVSLGPLRTLREDQK